MNATPNARVNSGWLDTPKGGLVNRTGRNDWIARPHDRVGMNQIKGFNTYSQALAYAETPSR